MFSILEPLVSLFNIWLLGGNKLCFLKSQTGFVIKVVLEANLLPWGQVCIEWRYLRLFPGDPHFELFFHFHSYLNMFFSLEGTPSLALFKYNISSRVECALKEADIFKKWNYVYTTQRNSLAFISFITAKVLCSNPDIIAWNILTKWQQKDLDCNSACWIIYLKQPLAVL